MAVRRGAEIFLGLVEGGCLEAGMGSDLGGTGWR